MTDVFRVAETIYCKAIEVAELDRAATALGVELPFRSSLEPDDVIFIHDDGRVTRGFEPRPVVFEGSFPGWSEICSSIGVAFRGA